MGRVVRLKGRPGWYAEWTDGSGQWHRRRVEGNREDARRVLATLEAGALEERDRLPRQTLAMLRKRLFELYRLAGGKGKGS